ncbi:O-antigen ligase family protein [Streptacidiphilus melanogenes]|uniref:O-antigen ligase family protein n=1 Tax=Streptacidiphilus melanogenes TaxID=411235 RepID=UPI0005A73C7F|nr:O-antigen ligase family protein [Streptacidiphilus melanogenes]
MPDTAVPPGVDAPARSDTVCDVVGFVLLAACAAWTDYCASGREAHPEGALLGLLAVSAGYATGRITGALAPLGGLVVPAAAAAVFAPAVGVRVLGDDAVAALLSLAVGAACCAGYAARERRLRWAARGCVLLALVLTAESLLTNATLGALACGGTLVVAGSVHRTRNRRRALLLLGACAALAVGAVLVCAHGGGTDPSAGGPTAEVSAQRLAVWQDAWQAVAQQPWRGVGPGDFADGSASSASLQQAAEQGWPGLVLLGGAFAWCLWWLGRSPRPTSAALSAAGAMTALGVQAAATPVLSVPAVVVCAGLLLGLGVARP